MNIVSKMNMSAIGIMIALFLNVSSISADSVQSGSQITFIRTEIPVEYADHKQVGMWVNGPVSHNKDDAQFGYTPYNTFISTTPSLPSTGVNSKIIVGTLYIVIVISILFIAIRRKKRKK